MIEAVILPAAKADVFADESCTPLLAEREWIACKACLQQMSILESIYPRAWPGSGGIDRDVSGTALGREMGSMASCCSLKLSVW